MIHGPIKEVISFKSVFPDRKFFVFQISLNDVVWVHYHKTLYIKVVKKKYDEYYSYL